MIDTGENTDGYCIWKCKSCGYREGRPEYIITGNLNILDQIPSL